MRSVSSKVMFPELPDARMETRKPIAFPQCRNKFSESSQSAATASTKKERSRESSDGKI